MKQWNLHILWLAIMVVLSSSHINCQKRNTDRDENTISEKPGKIPGMGEQAGQPTGEPFVLPKGTSLKGKIVGTEDPGASSSCVVDGSGEQVMVKMTIQRDSISGAPLTVTFPPGLVITSASEDYQHGLLVEKVILRLPPKLSSSDVITCNVTLLLQCMNKQKTPSDIFASYQFGPVTNSKLMKDLIAKLSTKKTTYSDYNQDGDAWRACSEGIRSAVWHITDGNGLDEDDLEFIKNLPPK